MILYGDSRESKETINKITEKVPSDMDIKIVKLDTFDLATELVGVELKSIEDFINAVLSIHERKTRDDYQRMEEQFERMCQDKRLIKLLLIHGSLKTAHSQLHPNSFNGMLASYTARGMTANPPVQVIYVGDDGLDWIDYIIRVINKAHKYVEHPAQSTFPIGE